jgi:phage minor structural protein
MAGVSMIIKYGDNIVDYNPANKMLIIDGKPSWSKGTPNGIGFLDGMSIKEVLSKFEGTTPVEKLAVHLYFKYEITRLDGLPFDKSKLVMRWNNFDPGAIAYIPFTAGDVDTSGKGEYRQNYLTKLGSGDDFKEFRSNWNTDFDGQHKIRMYDLMLNIETTSTTNRPYVKPLAWQENPPLPPLNPGAQKSYPILYNEKEKDFTHNGIGIMAETISAFVTEGRNAGFDFELSYPIDGIYAKELVNGKIVRMIPNTRYSYHNFIITNVEKDVSGYLRVSGTSKNIVDLGDNLIRNIKVKATPGNAMRMINTNSIDNMNYEFSSDMTDMRDVDWERRNPLNALVGEQGSAVDIWGGEIFRGDNSVILYKERGRNNGIQIRPGTNMRGFRMTTDTKPLVTRILPWASVQEEGQDDPKIIVGKIVESGLRNKYARQPILAVDFSDNDAVKTVADLERVSLNYFTYQNKGVDKPKVSIKADLITLKDSSDMNKYKLLEDIALCDTVNVYVKKYDVDVDIKVVEVTYDVINGRNSSVILGDKTLSPIGALAKETYSAINESSSKLEQYIFTNPNGQKIIYGGPRPDPKKYKAGDIWYEKINETEWNMYIHNGLDWELIIGDSIFRELRETVEVVGKEADEAKKRADDAYQVGVDADKKGTEAGLKADDANKKIEDVDLSTQNLDKRLQGSETDIVIIKTEQGVMNSKIGAIADGITDGGYNYLLKANDMKHGAWLDGTQEPGMISGKLGVIDGTQVWSMTKHVDISGWSYFGINKQLLVKPLGVSDNKEWGFTMRVHANKPTPFHIQIADGSGSNRTIGFPNIALKEGWQTVTIPSNFVNPASRTPNNIVFMGTGNWPKDTVVSLAWYVLRPNKTTLMQWVPAQEEDVDYRKFSELNQSINGLQSTVQDGFANIGSDNLLPYTSQFKDLTGWSRVGKGGTTSVTTHYFYKNGQAKDTLLLMESKQQGAEEGIMSTPVQLQRGATYTISFKAFGSGGVSGFSAWFTTTTNAGTNHTQYSLVSNIKPSAAKIMTYTKTFTVSDVSDIGYLYFANKGATTANGDSRLYVTEMILVQGTSVAGYTPGSAFTQTQITQLSDTIAMTNKKVDENGKLQETQYLQLSDTIALTNKTVDANGKLQQTQYTQLSDTIALTNKTVDEQGRLQQTQYTQLNDTIAITNKKVDDQGRLQQTQYTQLNDTIAITNKKVDEQGQLQQSQYTQLNDSINMRVTKGNIRSQINLEANNILFDVNGNLINITPTTTYIANATIKDAMIQSIKADKITAGTINAQNVNVINLNASNITTGTLQAILIKGPQMSLNLATGEYYTEFQYNSQLAQSITFADGKITANQHIPYMAATPGWYSFSGRGIQAGALGKNYLSWLRLFENGGSSTSSPPTEGMFDVSVDTYGSTSLTGRITLRPASFGVRTTNFNITPLANGSYRIASKGIMRLEGTELYWNGSKKW